MRNRLTDVQAVILTSLVSGPRYGEDIRESYAAVLGESLPRGTLYTTLARMEEGGLVRSKLGDAHPDGSNRRRYYSITARGAKLREEFRARIHKLDRIIA